MWKWYLNNNFQPYNYPQRLQGGRQVSRRLAIWPTRGGLRWKRWREYKREGFHYKRGMRKVQEKDLCNQEHTLYKSKNIFKNKLFSNSTKENFSFSTRCLQSLLTQANQNWFLLDSLNIQLQIHSLTNSLLWAYCVIVQIDWALNQSSPLRS